MEKLFIPYTLAVIAKEKGFNEECFGFYYHESIYAKRNPAYEKVLTINSNPSKNSLLAPTHQQIIDFLRVKYRKVISVNPVHQIYPKKRFMGFTYSFRKDGDKYIRDYYKALNKSIEEAFKLIK